MYIYIYIYRYILYMYLLIVFQGPASYEDGVKTWGERFFSTMS